MTGLEKLSTRRGATCLDFSIKCTEHAQNNRFFPKNPNLFSANGVRDCEAFKINFAQIKQYQNNAIPYRQNLLNEHVREKGSKKRPGAGAGLEQGLAWGRAVAEQRQDRGRGRSRGRGS